MPIGLPECPELTPIPGIRLSVASAGIARGERNDVALIEADVGTRCAAVFTRNLFCAAPVTISRMHLSAATPRYFLSNAGNANCGTGESGLRAAVDCCEAVASHASCKREEVLPFSTGVIGEPLAADKIAAVIPDLVKDLSEDGWLAAARAIMTTDTVPKGVSRHVITASGSYTLTGIAKGAGMIRPDMATMLAYVATDADVADSVLQRALANAVAHSFNRITVDGDTSTNDSCVLLATGASGVRIDSVEGDEYESFCEALIGLCVELAQSLIRDAEGITKFITIVVDGARDEAECAAVAYTIAHSPLVKTAFFASDPNWGRILAAVGRSGVGDLDLDRIKIFLEDVCIVREGGRAQTYTEEDGQRVMSQAEITLRVSLGRGSASTVVWTTDLSHDYVRINAEYRT